MNSRSMQMVEKSISAILAGIEIYNKPVFEYREETFSILIINSWELLLKARILQLEQNKLGAILEYERKKKVDGTPYKHKHRKINRSGNTVSIGLFKAFERLTNDYNDKISSSIKSNLEGVTEIRDNAIHFMNKDFALRKKIYELGTANILNYLNLARQWFGKDLSDYNLFLMPIAFVRDCHSATSQILNSQEKKVLDYVDSLNQSSIENKDSDFYFALEIDINLKRKNKDGTLLEVKQSNSPDALSINVTEEDIREKYPWDFAILTNRLKKKFTDFIQNNDYHKIKQELENDSRFCNIRLLDPSKPKGSSKKFYNPNIIKEFEKHYTKKKEITNE